MPSSFATVASRAGPSSIASFAKVLLQDFAKAVYMSISPWYSLCESLTILYSSLAAGSAPTSSAPS